MRWMNTNTVKSVCRSSWDGRTQTLLKASAGHEMNTFVKCVCRSWDGWTNTVNSNTWQYCHEMDQHKHCQMCKSWGGWTHSQKCMSWDGWTQTLSNVCRSWDGLTKTDIRAPLPPIPPPPPPPPPPPHVVTRALHILTTPTEQTSYPETWTKLQLMHQHMLLTKEYMNKRLITTVDQQNWVKMTANVVWWHTSTLKKYYHVPVFCNNKKAAASAPHGNAARRKWRIIARM